MQAQYGRKAALHDDVRRVYWGGVGHVKVKLHRPIPQDAVRKTVSIKRQGCHWYACIEAMLPKPAALPKTGKAVGIDLGITIFAALSTGEKIVGPRVQRHAQERVGYLQRAVARKQKGSNRRRKAVARLARARLHETRVRRDHHFKVVHSLVDRFDLIAIEDLDVSVLGRSMLAKDVLDQGWAQFRSILSDKAEEAGRQMVLVNPRRTTQTCSGCHRLVPKTLRMRTHSCSDCGLTLDRDVNAARNILRLGASLQDTAPAKSPLRLIGAARLHVESSG